jgi:thiamine transport system ATP-binding protein
MPERVQPPIATEGLDARDIAFHVGRAQILCGATLGVARGETVALLGPSGCGKTTLLRVIAGLERQAAGGVWFDGEDISHIAAHRRGFGLMFQDHALFPHLDVSRNIDFGLRRRGWGKADRERRVTELLGTVGLRGFEGRTLDGLSGGERQRVALARALAPEPRLLMLDEPLGSLDRGLRERLVVELRAILKDLAIPAIYVTHDQFEAFAVADRLAIMRDGVIVRTGTPDAVHEEPGTEFVARFLGMENIVPGTLGPGGMVESPAGVFGPIERHPGAGPVRLLLRAEGALVTDGNGPNVVRGRVVARVFLGGLTRLVLDTAAGRLEFPLQRPPAGAEEGSEVSIRVEKAQVLSGE